MTMKVSYNLLNHENVSMEVLIKICTILGVDFCDIMELAPEQTESIKSDIMQPQGAVLWKYLITL